VEEHARDHFIGRLHHHTQSDVRGHVAAARRHRHRLGERLAARPAPAALGGDLPDAIRHEEAYLERKFGDRYLEYKRSVRRWI
jgi:hypothetical protein